MPRKPWIIRAARRANARQLVLPFLERSDRRRRVFKLTIVAMAVLLGAAMIALSKPARYNLALSARRACDEFARRLFGLEPERAAIEAEMRMRRERAIERTQVNLSDYYASAPEEMRELFRTAGMDPEHGLIRYGRGDEAFLLSPQVFDLDAHGRAYRLRPNTGSVWLRQITLRGGPFGLFQVPDTPRHRAAAAKAGAIVDEKSRQTTNSWGLRGPEPDTSVPIRGLVLGDSFMQGMFNGDDDTPPIRLERQLRAQLNQAVAVLNTGHIGYSPEQYYFTLLEYGDRFRPRFVVCSVCPNDFGRGNEVVRGAADSYTEAAYWLGLIQTWCVGHNATFVLVPVPPKFQVESVSRKDRYPAPLCASFPRSSTLYCDPFNDFIDEHLRLLAESDRRGHRTQHSALYNYEIADDHFSPAGAELWAKVVARRVVRLLEASAPGGRLAVSTVEGGGGLKELLGDAGRFRGREELLPGGVVDRNSLSEPRGLAAFFDFSGQEDLAVGRRRARTPQKLDEPPHFAREGFVGGERGGIDEDRQHAAREPRRFGVARAVAGESFRENFGDDAESVALVSPERQNRARVGVEDLGIGRRRPLAVNHAPLRNGCLLVPSDFDFTFGDRTRRNINKNWEPALDRNPHRDRVGRQPAVDSAERRDQEAESAGADEVERNEAFLRRERCPIADSAQMPRVAQRDECDPLPLRLGDSGFRGELARRLAESVASVNNRDARGLEHNLRCLVRQDLPRPHPAEILRRANDSVRVVADQVRLDEVAGDSLGFRGGASRRRERALREFAERFTIDVHSRDPLVHRAAANDRFFRNRRAEATVPTRLAIAERSNRAPRVIETY